MNRIDYLREKAIYNGQHKNRELSDILRYRGLLENESENVHNVKRAKVIRYILNNYPIEIDEMELLVGRYSNRTTTPDEAEEAKKARDYIKMAGILYSAASGGTLHRVADYEKILAVGITGILNDINEKEKKISHKSSDACIRKHFYSACRIALEGLMNFAIRFRDDLTVRYENEKDVIRKDEYKRLLDIFSWIPINPARNFYEALQCVWFLQFTLCLVDDASLCGRPDQYLYLYYEREIEEGTMTRKSIMELIENYYLKTNELYVTWPGSLIVGGVDKYGQPVYNNLTEMFIEAIRTVKLINPSVAICYNESIPDRLLNKCVDILSEGYCKPAIFNDRVVIEGLLEAGMKPEDARNYIHSTCVEITSIGCSNIQVASPYINIIKGLELLLNDGNEIAESCNSINPGIGSIDIPCGSFNSFNPGICIDISKLNSFDAFFLAFKNILQGMIQKAVEWDNNYIYLLAEYGSNPLMSCFTDDCIERGKDSAAGGARYNYVYPCFPGFSSTVDALNAIRYAVYEKAVVTLDELKVILISNFKKNESLRQYLLNRCPKYGNDLYQADILAVELYDFIRSQLSQYRTCLDGTYHPSYFGWIMHGILGKVTAATPDGRLYGEALSECIGPVQGMDRKGPTAAVNSITKYDHKYGIGGIAANFRFSKLFLDNDKGKKAVAAFIREFMHKGGFEIQLNVIDQKTLLEAQKDSEKYRTLVVRVAGYSDYFINLDPVVQNEIIKRTEYGQV
ncbi:MAG: pyruvate formate lyase family protein [Clostridiales bacterium]|nr:pyruvate formate lyase family protein [Clostridiales bacterium]